MPFWQTAFRADQRSNIRVVCLFDTKSKTNLFPYNLPQDPSPRRATQILHHYITPALHALSWVECPMKANGKKAHLLLWSCMVPECASHQGLPWGWARMLSPSVVRYYRDDPVILAVMKTYDRRWGEVDEIWIIILMGETVGLVAVDVKPDRKPNSLWRLLLLNAVRRTPMDRCEIPETRNWNWPDVSLTVVCFASQDWLAR